MRTIVLVLGLMSSFGCSHKSTPSTGDPSMDPSADPSGGGNGVYAPSSLQVTGRIVDFETGQPLASSGTMATAAVVPPPNVSMSGGDFTLDGVPPFSVFYLIAGSPPDHRLTYNAPTTVTDQPLTDVKAYVVADAYLTKLRTAFGVTAQSGTATVFLQAHDSTGAASTGISAAALVVPGTGVKGPFFVDTKLQAAPQATATSSSGWMVYFNVPSGTLIVAAGTGYSVQAADTPVAADAVSLVSATVARATAPTPPPSNVSFQQTVLPIFIQRGCYNCHSGNGAGRRQGDLVLDGSAMKIYAALTTDISPNFKSTRVNLKDPPKSLVLTMPSLETPPDPHPTVVFTSSADVDYQKILVWIKEGAKLN